LWIAIFTCSKKDIFKKKIGREAAYEFFRRGAGYTDHVGYSKTENGEFHPEVYTISRNVEMGAKAQFNLFCKKHFLKLRVIPIYKQCLTDSGKIIIEL